MYANIPKSITLDLSRMYMRTTDGAQEFKLVKDFYGRTSFLFCNIHSVREDINCPMPSHGFRLF